MTTRRPRRAATEQAKPAPRRIGGRSARVVTAVLKAALKQLSEKGYAGLSIEEVALAAGVNKTTIYRRWPTRCELVRAALLSIGEEGADFPDSGALPSDLAMLVREQAAFARSPRGHCLASVRLAKPLEPDLAPILRKSTPPSLGHARQVIERAVARGELPVDTDAAFLHETLLGAVSHRVLFTHHPIDDAFIQNLVSLVLHGLTNGGAQTQAAQRPPRAVKQAR